MNTLFTALSVAAAITSFGAAFMSYRAGERGEAIFWLFMAAMNASFAAA